MMRSRMLQALLLLALLLSAGCGAAKRVAAASVLALESHAVLTQSTFDGKAAPLPKRCNAAKNASLMLNDAFAPANVWVIRSMKPRTFSVVALKKCAPVCPGAAAQAHARRV